MPRHTVFLDTSFIIALENRRDPHHERAKAFDLELLQQSSQSVLHWSVLMETVIGARIMAAARRVKTRESFPIQTGQVGVI